MPMYMFFVRTGAVALALVLAAEIVPGIRIDSVTTALLSAVVLGLLNTLIRPILIILTLPITILTLGLFLIVINSIMFAVAAWLLSGFVVETYIAAVIGSLLVTAVSIVVNRSVRATA